MICLMRGFLKRSSGTMSSDFVVRSLTNIFKEPRGKKCCQQRPLYSAELSFKSSGVTTASDKMQSSLL